MAPPTIRLSFSPSSKCEPSAANVRSRVAFVGLAACAASRAGEQTPPRATAKTTGSAGRRIRRLMGPHYRAEPKPGASAKIGAQPVFLERAAMIEHDIQARLRQLGHLVGNTPLLAIQFSLRGQKRVVYAKAENLNMTGSIKDRMALHIVRQAYQRGAPGAGRADVRGDQREHRDLVLRDRPRDGAPGHDLHARLDEPRAHRPDSKPGCHHPPGPREEGGFLGQHPARGGVAAAVERAFLPAAVLERGQRATPTRRPPAPKSTGSSASGASSRTPSSRAWGRAAPSWASAAT